MKLVDCKECKNYQNLIAMGLGPRCKEEKNKKYLEKGDRVDMPIVISRVPEPCEYIKYD